jgi:hypothetical protein
MQAPLLRTTAPRSARSRAAPPGTAVGATVAYRASAPRAVSPAEPSGNVAADELICFLRSRWWSRKRQAGAPSDAPAWWLPSLRSPATYDWLTCQVTSCRSASWWSSKPGSSCPTAESGPAWLGSRQACWLGSWASEHPSTGPSLPSLMRLRRPEAGSRRPSLAIGECPPEQVTFPLPFERPMALTTVQGRSAAERSDAHASPAANLGEDRSLILTTELSARYQDPVATMRTVRCAAQRGGNSGDRP